MCAPSFISSSGIPFLALQLVYSESFEPIDSYYVNELAHRYLLGWLVALFLHFKVSRKESHEPVPLASWGVALQRLFIM